MRVVRSSEESLPEFRVRARIDGTAWTVLIPAASPTEAQRRLPQDLHRGEDRRYRTTDDDFGDLHVVWTNVATLEVGEVTRPAGRRAGR